MSPDRIQDGIYFRSGTHAPPCYRLLLLNLAPDLEPPEAAAAIERVYRMLTDFRRGLVRDLDGASPAETSHSAASLQGLDVLVAYGRPLFDPAHHPRLGLAERRPPGVVYLRQDGPFPSIRWSRNVEPGAGEADVALQFTGPTEASVNRAAVEVWKLVADERLPMTIAGTYSGFQRTDGRGWLEFHDGVSNMAADHRLEVIATWGEPAWMEGGTYMAFLRCAVDLPAWRSLSRSMQELIVGRDKLSGIPLAGVDRSSPGDPRPIPAALPAGGPAIEAHADYADPPQTTDPLLEASHVHRANQNRASPYAPGGLRIFRQGYEFLDSFDERGPVAGLNFTSFQAQLSTLQNVLHLPGWLGDSNFGGPAAPGEGEPPATELISLLAGGLYAVPPKASPFPGATLLGRT